MSAERETESGGVEHGTTAEPPPTEEELDIEGPNESAPGHNPEDDEGGDEPPAAA